MALAPRTLKISALKSYLQSDYQTRLDNTERQGQGRSIHRGVEIRPKYMCWKIGECIEWSLVFNGLNV